MKLRDHPTMTFQGVSQWPPSWGRTGDARKSGGWESPCGEEGVLKGVENHAAPRPGHLSLVIEYKGNQFRGLVSLNDDEFRFALCQKLGGCMGKAIREIGDIEIDF